MRLTRNIMVVILGVVISLSLGTAAIAASGGITSKPRCKGDFMVNYAVDGTHSSRNGGSKYLDKIKVTALTKPWEFPGKYMASWKTKSKRVLICRVVFMKRYDAPEGKPWYEYREVSKRLPTGPTRGRTKKPLVVPQGVPFAIVVWGKLK